MVATNATSALMIANGGEKTATIDRTKNPVVIASVTNRGILELEAGRRRRSRCSTATPLRRCIRTSADRPYAAPSAPSASREAPSRRRDRARAQRQREHGGKLPCAPRVILHDEAMPPMMKWPARSSHGANVQLSTRRSARSGRRCLLIAEVEQQRLGNGGAGARDVPFRRFAEHRSTHWSTCRRAPNAPVVGLNFSSL